LESFERTERPVGGSVGNDAACENAADPRQRFDLALTRHIQIHHGRGISSRLISRNASHLASHSVRFTSDCAERLAHPPFCRIRSGARIRRETRSDVTSGVASIDGSSARARRAARRHVGVARRIDGRHLSRERLTVGGIGRSAAARGPHHTHARAEHNDTSEEQQRFAFGGRGHGAKIAAPNEK
jgi:hypothetical protein